MVHDVEDQSNNDHHADEQPREDASQSYALVVALRRFARIAMRVRRTYGPWIARTAACRSDVI